MFEHRVTISSTAVPQSTLSYSQLASAVSMRKGSSAQPHHWCEVVVLVVMDDSVFGWGGGGGGGPRV